MPEAAPQGRPTSPGIGEASEAPRTASAYRRVRQRRHQRVVLIVAAGLLAAGLGGVYAYDQGYTGQTRNYYIAALEEEWNYTPLGFNAINVSYLSASPVVAYYTTRNATYLGSSFLKCVYQQFTNASFSEEVPRTGNQLYLGILGPVLYAEVGDTLHVHFRNECRYPEGLHPQGLYYPSNDSGPPMNGSLPEGAGGLVPPGEGYNYSWTVAPSDGPGPTDGSSVLWPYFSGPSMQSSSDAGLMGPIIVTAPGEANPNGTPEGIGSNFIIMAATLNEAASPYLSYNIGHDAFDPSEVDRNSTLWLGSLDKDSLNGFLYGNLYAPQLRWGRTVRWYVFSPDSASRSLAWEGNRVAYGGTETSTVPLTPSTTEVADMTPVQNGTWLFGSTNASEAAGGMQAWYQVSVPAGTLGGPWPALPAARGLVPAPRATAS